LFIADTFFVTGSDDATAKVWDKAKGKCLRTLKGHTELVTCISASTAQKENLICTSSLDNTVRIWNEKGECTKVIEGHETIGWIWSMVISNDRIYLGGQNGIKIYNQSTAKWVPLNFEGHTKPILTLAVKGEVVHTGSWDKTVRGWKEKGRAWRASAVNANFKDIEKYYSSGRTGSFVVQRTGSGSNIAIPPSPNLQKQVLSQSVSAIGKKKFKSFFSHPLLASISN